jgi:stress response protein YsnF
MAQSFAEVTTANGRKGSVDLDALSQAAATDLVCVQMADSQQIWIVSDTLVQQSDGQFLLPIAVPEPPRHPRLNESADESETTVIPVIEEQAVISKRLVRGGGVRISKVVREREETVHTTLAHQETDVTRVPVGEFVSEPEQTRKEGDTLIVPVYEEVMVVEKRLRLRERLIITRRLVETEQEEPVVLRAEEAFVERLEPGASHAETDAPDR